MALPRFARVRDYNADEKVNWHDYYLEALTPVQTVSVKLGDLLFTPVSALLHTIWFVAWFALGLDINLLTLVVSLEAIYITLFIGLGQRLQDKRAAVQSRADKAEAGKAEAHRQQLSESQSKLLGVNTDLTEQVAQLTNDIHRHPRDQRAQNQQVPRALLDATRRALGAMPPQSHLIHDKPCLAYC